jgi:hypothetical protein
VDKEQLQALAAMPITRPVSKGDKQDSSNVVGVLAVGKKYDSYLWTPREVRLLTSIANQVAPAIDNARLYAKVHEGEVGLRTGNEILQEINDMLLEKNANLENFIQNDLCSALTMATQILNGLSADESVLTDSQRKNINTLQKIINRLNELAREVSVVSDTLDSEFDKILNSDEKKDNFGGLVKPLRLEKKSEANSVLKSAIEQKIAKDKDTGRPSKNFKSSSVVDASPMSFEDAVAAGLVPPGILDRETKHES